MSIFHVSENPKLKILKPRIPNNILTNEGYEDNTIPRVCFSKSIDQCLMATGKLLEEKILYVYEPKEYSVLNILENYELIKNNLVPDAKYTGELWVLNEVKIKLLGEIKIVECKDWTQYMVIYNNENNYRLHGLMSFMWE